MVATNLLARIAPLSEELNTLAGHLRQSVVTIQSGGGGAGAGVVWSASGLIVTNDHVAQGERVGVVLPDGERLIAPVIARDRDNDLAALKVERSNLIAAPVADSNEVRVGQLVLALGHPLGLEYALTAGVASGLPAPGDGRDLIRADLTLNPGNSGGPLVDAEGRVIGINAMITSPGVALAVPSRVVQAFVARATRPLPYLGIIAQAVRLPDAWRQAGAQAPTGGLIVTRIDVGSPAHVAGLLPGDVIVGAGSRLVWDPRQLRDEIALAGASGLLSLSLLRGGEPRTVEARLASRGVDAGSEDGGRRAA